MWTQFFLENIHFALNMFAALVFFAVFWLYFDAWLGRKTLKEGLRSLGLILLSISFVIHAATIEITVFESIFASKDLESFLLLATRVPAYMLIIASLILDPLQPKPEHSKIAKASMNVAIPGVMLPVIASMFFLHPMLSVIIGFLYLRRGTIGLENHLKPIAASFFILSIAELLSLGSLLRNTPNVDIYNLVAPFGYLWIVEHLILLFSMIVLGKWVFGYLLKRLQSQLFMIFTSLILVIFLLTTVTFTFLLLKNLETETLKQLESDVKVLDYSLSSKKAEGLSDAQVIAQNPQVINDTTAKSHKPLYDTASSFLLTKKQSFLVILSDSGQVLARGEDKEKFGDSMSDDPLVKRGLLGESASSVITKEGVLAPEVSVRSVTPIKQEQKIVGVVLTGSTIDSAFVDGVKKATGLEAAIYGDNVLSATTLVAVDGKSRSLGIKEENTNIKSKVLTKGESYSGSVDILNIPYFGAYLPLKDVDNNPVGMLFVGKQQVGVLQAAGRSIELTFIIAAILMALSVIPAYFISKYLTYQIH